MRTFLAIGMPDLQRDQIERVQRDLRVGHKVAPENLHLTIAYLGEQSLALLDEVHLALEAMRAPRAEILLSGLGSFGEPVPHTLFVGVRVTTELRDLHRKTRSSLHAAGLALRHARLRPHVTIARLSDNPGTGDLTAVGSFLGAYAAFSADPFTATALTLYESRQGKSGRHYLPLADYPLQGP